MPNLWGKRNELPRNHCRHCEDIIEPRQHRDKNGRSRGWYVPSDFCSIKCNGLIQIPKLRAKSKGFVDKYGYPLLSRLNSNQEGKSKSYQQPRHIAVMERHLGRRLNPWETVHHKNLDRSDYRLENLELWTGRHGKGARVEDLTAEIADIMNGIMSLAT